MSRQESVAGRERIFKNKEGLAKVKKKKKKIQAKKNTQTKSRINKTCQNAKNQ
jgi:hypothetical protein